MFIKKKKKMEALTCPAFISISVQVVQFFQFRCTYNRGSVRVLDPGLRGRRLSSSWARGPWDWGKKCRRKKKVYPETRSITTGAQYIEKSKNKNKYVFCLRHHSFEIKKKKKKSLLWSFLWSRVSVVSLSKINLRIRLEHLKQKH